MDRWGSSAVAARVCQRAARVYQRAALMSHPVAVARGRLWVVLAVFRRVG